MTIEFILPELGENVTKGTVVSIFVAAGDTINLDQPILEIETDKAVIEVPSNVSGVIKQVVVKEGDTVKPGQLILTIAAAGGSAVLPKPLLVEAPAAPPPPPPPETPPPSPPAPAAEEVIFELPELGENVLSGTIVSIFAAVGDQIVPDQPLLEIETDKAVIEVPATRAGQVTQILVNTGDKVSPGQAVLKLLAASATAKSVAAQPIQSAPAPLAPEKPAPPAVEVAAPVAPVSVTPSQRPPQEVEASPSVRRLAREIGVDVTAVPGSGPAGRILLQDVKEFSRQKHLSTVQVQPAEVTIIHAAAERPLPDFTRWGAIETEPMSNVRRVTAEHLSHAWQAPHVTQFDKADITEVEAFRKKYAKLAEAAGGKLTVTVILLKVLAAALKKFPQFNASVDMAQQQVVYKKYYHLGVAIDTPRGLLVPVIRNVDQKNIIQLAAELAQISERARNRKTGPDELQGGTFTISNLGGIGGTAFTPVVDWPEVAILGVSRGSFEPVYNTQTGQFEPRLMLPLSLSYDHRLIDGADGARFIRWIVEVLENPFLLSLEG